MIKAKLTTYILIIACLTFGCKSSSLLNSYQTDSLKVQKIGSNTFIHTTYLQTEKYGKVPCNGIFVIDNGEAIVIDTPTNDSVSSELINFIEKELKSKVKAIVVTHFHVDCLGGLSEFHNRNIVSYANNKTIRLAMVNKSTIPQNGFDSTLVLNVGEKKIINEFVGEGHTVDNIVSFVQEDQILFGGCLIKSLGAGKGNLDDANITEWSNSVRKVKQKFTATKIVVPGHGKFGGTELLDYTIEKFKNGVN